MNWKIGFCPRESPGVGEGQLSKIKSGDSRWRKGYKDLAHPERAGALSTGREGLAEGNTL